MQFYYRFIKNAYVKLWKDYLEMDLGTKGTAGEGGGDCTGSCIELNISRLIVSRERQIVASPSKLIKTILAERDNYLK